MRQNQKTQLRHFETSLKPTNNTLKPLYNKGWKDVISIKKKVIQLWLGNWLGKKNLVEFG